MSATHPADELQRRPLYRTEYEELGRLGMFDHEKVELLDGEVIYAAEEGPPHAAVCARLARILFDAIPASEGEIRVSNPFALSELSEPGPDFLVAPPQPDSYRTGHPATASLVIEVAQTSVGRDLGVKARLYAAGAVPDYWVVAVGGEEVVVHREPAGGTFGSIRPPRRHHPGAAPPSCGSRRAGAVGVAPTA